MGEPALDFFPVREHMGCTSVDGVIFKWKPTEKHSDNSYTVFYKIKCEKCGWVDDGPR